MISIPIFTPSLIAIYFSSIGIGETRLNEKSYFVPQEEGLLLVLEERKFSATEVGTRQLGWKRRREEGNVEAAARRGYRERRVVWSRKRRMKERRRIHHSLGSCRKRAITGPRVFSFSDFWLFHNFLRVRFRECFSGFPCLSLFLFLFPSA